MKAHSVGTKFLEPTFLSRQTSSYVAKKSELEQASGEQQQDGGWIEQQRHHQDQGLAYALAALSCGRIKRKAERAEAQTPPDDETA